jgi:hypothetical protein
MFLYVSLTFLDCQNLDAKVRKLIWRILKVWRHWKQAFKDTWVWSSLGSSCLWPNSVWAPAGKHDSNPDSNHPNRGRNWLRMSYADSIWFVLLQSSQYSFFCNSLVDVATCNTSSSHELQRPWTKHFPVEGRQKSLDGNVIQLRQQVGAKPFKSTSESASSSELQSSHKLLSHANKRD